MSAKFSPATIGAFVLGAIVLGIFAVVFFGGGKLFRSTSTYVSYFPGSIKGLEVGAPVTFRGVRIGSVTDIQAVYDIDKNSISLPVVFQTESDQLQAIGDPKNLNFDPDDHKAAMQHLIDIGLRARLEMRSLVTGQLNIELDMFPDSPVRLLGLPSPYKEVPTLPTTVEELKGRLEKFLDRLDDLPLADIVKKLDETLVGIDRLVNSDQTRSLVAGLDGLVNSPELKSAIGNLDRALASFDATMRSAQGLIDEADGKLEPVYQSFLKTSRGLDAALVEAGALMDSLQGAVSEDSGVRERMNRAMDELEAAAYAVRGLADYLERHPEALIKGKPQAGDNR